MVDVHGQCAVEVSGIWQLPLSKLTSGGNPGLNISGLSSSKQGRNTIRRSLVNTAQQLPMRAAVFWCLESAMSRPGRWLAQASVATLLIMRKSCLRPWASGWILRKLSIRLEGFWCLRFRLGRRGTAYHLDGAYLMRSGEALVPMSEDQLRRILAEGSRTGLRSTRRLASARRM